ncbi:MAG TPA: uroporphyrinogen decarboxylase family protein [Ruminiclostridium sp.]
MEVMTSRERMMIAMRNGQPDRIPVAPDISNMIPCRLVGKPFWEVYENNKPPLWKAYLEAVKFFNMDGWFIYGEMNFKKQSPITITRKILELDDEKCKVEEVFHTPDGDLRQITVNPKGNPPTHIEKMIKDFEGDFKKFKHFYSRVTGCDSTLFQHQKKELGEQGIMCVCIMPPGLQNYVDFFQGSLEAVTYAYYDYPELFKELQEMHEKQCIDMLEIAIDNGVDCILTGGSGSITLQSPDIWRELSLPGIKKITRLCKEAGVISGIHSCGKEEYIVKVCAEETDLDYINPLEIAPMGDCDLGVCKERYGNKLALMGNLHTTNVMLYGSTELVKLESLKAIKSAGVNGGFVLSTGDQCGRDTPFENIFTMVDTAKEYGQYPLDLDKITQEIKRLENKME